MIARGPFMACIAAVAAPTADDGALELAVDGLDPAELVSALRLRLPRMRLTPGGGRGAPLRPGDVRVHVVRSGDALELTATLADGRVVRRTLAVEGAAPERTVAAVIAHWLAALAVRQPTPVPVVAASQPAIGTQPVAPAPSVVREAGPSTQPVSPAPSVVRGSAGPSAPPKTSDDRRPARATPEPPRLELGPVAATLPMFGVGRPSPARSLGVAVAVGLELRARRGALAGAEVRVLDARAGDYHLTRLRGALLGGYGVTRGRFIVRAQVGFTVESWWSDGRGASLFGGLARVTPGLRARLGPRSCLHAGLRLELGVSATAAGAAVRLVDDARPVFRLGGVELGAGLELGLQWDIAGRR